MNERDSYQAMLDAVQAFHDKHDFKNTGGEDMTYRVALMAEELGEISSCVTSAGARAARQSRSSEAFGDSQWVPAGPLTRPLRGSTRYAPR